MTVLYGRTDATQYNCEPTGCRHVRKFSKPEERNIPWALHCDKCAPYRLREGWSVDPAKYPRTPEQQAAEAKEGAIQLDVLREMTRAMVDAARTEVGTRKGQ